MSRMWQKVLVAALIVAGLVLVAGFMLWLTPFLMIRNVMNTAYEQLLMASVPRRLAFGVLLVAGTPFILAVMRLFSLRAPFLDGVWPPKKLHAFVLIGLYVGGFSLLLFYLTRDQHFMPGQKDYICCVDYQFYERAGVCPVHGRPLEVVTPDALGVDVAPRLAILGVAEPPKRKGGGKVADVKELVAKLRNEAKVVS